LHEKPSVDLCNVVLSAVLCDASLLQLLAVAISPAFCAAEGASDRDELR
jgi:hypothetical protein